MGKGQEKATLFIPGDGQILAQGEYIGGREITFDPPSLKLENTSMFDQPRLTGREVFARGFLNGLASVWLSFILSLVWSLWNEFRDGSLTIRNLRSDVVPVWLVICTLGCLAFAFPKDEERLNLFRSGLATAYVIFLLLDSACWLVKF